MFSSKLKSLEKQIDKIRRKRNPTEGDLDAFENLTAKHYYVLAQALNSVHFIGGGEWLH